MTTEPDDLVKRLRELTSHPPHGNLHKAMNEAADTIERLHQDLRSRQNIQIIVNRLEQAGYLESGPNPAHRRADVLSITAKGKGLLQRTQRPQEQVVEHFERQVSGPDLAAGLRLLEGAQLQVGQVDGARMVLHIHGKGKQDRYTILSKRLLGELRRYKQTDQPVSWVFFGKNRNCPLDITAAQKVYNVAKQKSGLEKGRGILPPIFWKAAWTW